LIIAIPVLHLLKKNCCWWVHHIFQQKLNHVKLLARDQWSTKDNGADEVPDDEVFGSGPVKIGLVTLELWPADSAEDGKMVSAAREGDSVTLERLLQCPRDPNVTGWNTA
jgi:hypothetical protein